MIAAQEFLDALDAYGFTTASGVPCSSFGGPIALLARNPDRYVPAANEGTALAVAAGVALAGGKPYVMLQNSGLGNLINPLTSLVMTYQVPVLVFVSLRGWPDPASDEPQHVVMGSTTHALLDTLGADHQTLTKDTDAHEFRVLLDRAEASLKNGRAAFVLVQRGAVGSAAQESDEPVRGLNSPEVMRAIVDGTDGCAVVATTGYTARELFGTADRPNHFYMQGSMGHASAMALGLAVTRPERTVVVIDGDGAALMHLGALSVIGDRAPANLVHVVLDNGRHESTGGQRTTSSATDFVRAAEANAYRTAVRCTSIGDVAGALATARSSPGPHMIVVPTLPRTGAMPPRATNALSAPQIAARFGADLTR
ncbi:phosphonopyruvate decarboxylase [Catenuloplanes japonicus]|uniref:phosphonopyruvate decarboxylase n=1 Tax=Catenuloplanes japonicus TaxID=33876 RepID=UPI0005277894|nr:phosphonopyruvate decarboxylase [Catenuloplanes japonicus]